MPRCARISYAEIARYNLLPPSQREVARRQPRRRECPTPRSRGERFLRKAFSPGRRCHAFWRDGCGVHRCTGQSGNLYRVPSTPGPFGATLCKQERAFLCFGRLCVDFYRSNIAGWRAGHAHAPTKPRRGCVPPLTLHAPFGAIFTPDGRPGIRYTGAGCPNGRW